MSSPSAPRSRPVPTGDRHETLSALRARIAEIAPPRNLPVGLATGWGPLEAVTGGWPSPGLALIEGPPGSGRLRALLPALARLTRSGRRVAVVDPLEQLHPPGLDGVLLDNLLLVRPAPARALWATEQLARCPALPLILLLDPPPLGRSGRRLLTAAEAGGNTLVVLSDAPQHDLPASLRLSTRRDAEAPPGPALRLLRGGRGANGRWIPLPLPAWGSLPEDLRPPLG